MRRQAITHADHLFSQGKGGWRVSALTLETARRIERWTRRGALLTKWADFVTRVQQQVTHSLSDQSSGHEHVEWDVPAPS